MTVLTLEQEVRLAAAQLRVLVPPPALPMLATLERAAGHYFRLARRIDFILDEHGAHSVRAERLEELNGILAEAGEPDATIEELERVPIILDPLDARADGYDVGDPMRYGPDGTWED